MELKALIDVLEQWAPKIYAESFDNVGLLVGDINALVTSAIITLDTTEEVLEEAIKLGANCIISFHPIIFSGIKSITGKNYVERIVKKAIQNQINIYAIHTNLDNIDTGVNFQIAKKLGLQQTQILIPKENTLLSLSFYEQIGKEQKVLEAIHMAGAGQIGNYKNCSFSMSGEGKFTPAKEANPTLGEIGKEEKVHENLIKVIVETSKIEAVIKALKQNHSYEEVAYEITVLQNQNQTKGIGLIGNLEKPLSPKDFLKFLKDIMQTQIIRHSQLGDRPIKKIAVLGGSGSFAIDIAKQNKADAYVSADFKYHDFFKAENQILLADIGHYESEQYTKELIYNYITKKLPTFAVQISKINTNPIHYF